MKKSPQQRLDHLDDEIVEALRTIYFTPVGVLRILEKIVAGQEISRELVEERLPHFNDAEWRIGRALTVLDFEEGVPKELTLRRARTLEQLRYGKINLRRQIQDFLNGPLTYGDPVSKEIAGNLLDQVRELNAEIEALEEAHNYKARR